MRLSIIPWVAGHLAFWSLVLLALLRILGVQQMENVEILNGVRSTTISTINASFDAWVVWGCSVVIFYMNAFYLLPRFFKAGKTKLYVLALAAVAVIIAAAAFLLITYVRPSFQSPHAFGFPVYGGLIIVAALLVVSYAYFFIIEWVSNERIKRNLREENLKTELNFLRAQIQPHFLFNVLNNLMSMAVETGHKELVGGIDSLSSLMRYMVYEGNQEKIQLTSEVNYIEHYIQLQGLKFASSDHVRIRFHKEGNFSTVQLAPFVLLPLVENAFKYGINLESESVINIDLREDKKEIHFRISNTDFSAIHATNKEKSGVGLENVRRRLDLIYPGQHQLRIESSQDYFSVSLTIRYSS